MDSNNEEEGEIQEITIDKESEKQGPTTLLGTETEKEGISIEESNANTSVESQRELDEKKKTRNALKGIKEILLEWRSEITRRCHFICGYPDQRVPRVCVYQVWPGKNIFRSKEFEPMRVFFFRGRMICGPDPRGFILTVISIIICEWIFFSYRSDVSPKILAVVSIISVTLSIIVLTNLFLVGTRDPGIIPRNQNTQLMETGTSAQSKSIRRSRSRRVNVNGIEIKVKYCRICEIFRPPRSSHCAVCDNCVDKFDHHCPWTGQCIGLRNYRHYLMFVFSAFVFFLFIFVVSSWRIMMKMATTNNNTLGIIKHMPEIFTLAIFSLMVVWFLGGLLVFHGYLISLNQTAHERFKQRYINSVNPYDKGTRENIKEALFAKLEPSRLNFRAVAKPEWNSIAKALSYCYSPERAKNGDAQTEMQRDSCSGHNIDPEIEDIEV
ncbi:putative protein S-acyltransferase 1 [Carex rostrata]